MNSPKGKGALRVLRSLLWLLLPLSLQAELIFLLDSSGERSAIEASRSELQEILHRHADLSELAKRKGLRTVIRKEGHDYYLLSNPLPEDDETLALYWKLNSFFPKMVALPKRISSQAPAASLPPPTLSRMERTASEEDFTLWLALFALAVTGVLGLYASSVQVRRLQERHEKILRQHEKIEQRINELFSRLGEDICQIGQETVDYTHQLIEKVSEREVGIGLKRVVSMENRMVARATNLLGFLKLKARKIDVRSDAFSIDSLLDDVLESLLESRQPNAPELIFEIDRNVPRYLKGDFVHIGEILSKLLEYTLQHNDGETVRLEINAYNPYIGGTELFFRIHYSPQDERLDPDTFFVPIYDEQSGEYRHIGLFIAHELTDLLKGEISVAMNERKREGLIELTLPVHLAKGADQRKYHLPDKKYTKKNVLIVNRHYESSVAIKKMFAYFKHRVTVMELERFEKSRPDLERYDILLLDEALVDPVLLEALEQTRKRQDLKVVLLHNIFEKERELPKSDAIDQRVNKPLNLQRVYSLILELYGERDEEYPRYEPARQEDQRHFIDLFERREGVNLESFARFAGATIMIVEDNPVNMEILKKILHYSGIWILSASNGAEAVRKMEEAGIGEIRLVLMDINMPVMDGYQATAAIRKLPDGEKVPIIALSALNLENERHKMERVGMDGFLPKPLDIGRLYTVFERYLHVKEGAQKPQVDTKEREHPGEIDWNVALAGIDGNEALLDELLEGFVEAYEESDKKLNSLFMDRRFEEMRKMLIDLMGVSRSIGAKKLQRASKELYRQLILHKLQEVPPLLKEYGEVLRSLIRSLKHYLG